MTNNKTLGQVADALTGAGCQVSIRGDGVARFVLAEHHGRAVEICPGEHDFYVECFLPDEEYACTESQEPSYEAAIQQALGWLIQT
jgi:hypothetical protein